MDPADPRPHRPRRRRPRAVGGHRPPGAGRHLRGGRALPALAPARTSRRLSTARGVRRRGGAARRRAPRCSTRSPARWSRRLLVRDGDVLDLGGDVGPRGRRSRPHRRRRGVRRRGPAGEAEHVFVGDAAQCYGAASGFPGYEDPDAYRAHPSSASCAEDPQHLYLGHPYRQRGRHALPGGARRPRRRRGAHGQPRARGTGPRCDDQRRPGARASRRTRPSREHAARLGYTGDPTLEPSPFFTTMRGYLRDQESTHA